MFPDKLTGTRFKVHALQFFSKILLSMEVALPFFLFLNTPHGFIGQLVLLVLVTLRDIVMRVYQAYLRIREGHFFIILLGQYRLVPGSLEELHAGQLLHTLSLSP